MSPRLKKSCSDCRALSGDTCGLGYKVERTMILDWMSGIPKPLEPCPKPRTYDAYILQSELHRGLRGVKQQ